MKRVTTEIKGNQVELIAVEQGEKVSRVRREAGLEIGGYIAIRIGGMDADAEDAADFERAYPEMAGALKAAGVDIEELSAVIEVKSCGNL